MKRCIENLQIWQFSRALVNRIYEITAISKDYDLMIKFRELLFAL